MVIPKKSHIAALLVRHFHEQTKHQGRHFTEGAIRSAGFWIVGAKRLISSYILGCVNCRRLRGKTHFQQMADLPSDRVTPAPPFSSVGIDMFGPWQVVTQRTRGGMAHNKRWAVLFTCLTIRAVHIEVIEEMTSACFINALRRFIAIRGEVKLIRSDRGTNFIEATDDLQVDAINVGDTQLKEFLYNKGVTWIFNPPHAPHMGGVWECIIGVAKRILNSVLMEAENKKLTHEILVTLLAEVSSIINARPITSVSTDSEEPCILSPSMLLTQKTDFTNDFASHLDTRDMYRSSWKCVQVLAEKFWSRWKTEYVHTLQRHVKWEQPNRDLSVNDIVLLKDNECDQNNWPLAIVNRTFTGSDGRVRKVEVVVTRDGKKCTFVRPVTELVLLL